MNMTKNKAIVFISIFFVCTAVLALLYYTDRMGSKSEDGGKPADFHITYRKNDGTILAREGVYAGKPALPKMPVPELGGKVFAGWDKDISVAGGDIETTAKYADVSGADNVISLPARYGTAGDVFKLPLKILGKVESCGSGTTLMNNAGVLEVGGNERA